MKINLAEAIITIFAGACIVGIVCFRAAEPVVEPPKTQEPSFEDLLDAIEWVESRGNPLAVGDNGEAIGAYQIHKIYVDDCNRIWNSNSRLAHFYQYDDRLNTVKSREMVKRYLKHYGGTFEEMARKHNGGPQGHKKESTKPYWEKVKARMEQVKAEGKAQ